jgi:CheY-like chemotaxis protein
MTRPEAHHPILIVDDDDDIRESLAECLELEGFAVTTAANGAEGLARLRDDATPSLVLLDLMMPVLDGYGFLEQQRKDPRIAQVPVLVITAGSFDRRRTGNAEIMRKPLDLGRLLAIVAGARGRSGAA